MGAKSWDGRKYLRNEILQLLAFFFLFLCASCARHQEDPLIAQMQMRNMQTRTFVGETPKRVSKEVIAVLQDEGFMIKNISSDLGLITAERNINIEKFSSKFWAYIFSGKQASWKKHSLIEMTTNVIEEEGKTKIRVNYLIRIFDNLGHVIDIKQVDHEEPYIDFFTKIQNGLLKH